MSDPFTNASPTYIAAQKTNQGGGKGWDFAAVPAEPKTPGFVIQVVAWGCGLAALFIFTPVIIRALMA